MFKLAPFRQFCTYYNNSTPIYALILEIKVCKISYDNFIVVFEKLAKFLRNFFFWRAL